MKVDDAWAMAVSGQRGLRVDETDGFPHVSCGSARPWLLGSLRALVRASLELVFQRCDGIISDRKPMSTVLH